MEKARMLGTEQVVVGGTEGGRSPTGVPPTTTAAAALGVPAAGNGYRLRNRRPSYRRLKAIQVGCAADSLSGEVTRCASQGRRRRPVSPIARGCVRGASRAGVPRGYGHRLLAAEWRSRTSGLSRLGRRPTGSVLAECQDRRRSLPCEVSQTRARPPHGRTAPRSGQGRTARRDIGGPASPSARRPSGLRVDLGVDGFLLP